MRKVFTCLLLILLHLNCLAYTNGVWQAINANYVPSLGKRLIIPEHFAAYQLNTDYFHSLLLSIGDKIDNAQQVELPMPDGSFRSFTVWQCHVMQPELEQKYADIKTYSGYATDNAGVTIKLDYTEKGFHAMVYDGANSYLIDPYSNVNNGYYICYYGRDYNRPENSRNICAVHDTLSQLSVAKSKLQNGMRQVNGYGLKTYRLALACTGEYAAAVDAPIPTKAGVLSVMVTNLNRVNGVYERELAVNFILINKEDTLIFLKPGWYSNNNINAMTSENQKITDSLVGNANYDIGHVFSTGPGGVSQIGCICRSGQKAEGTTGSTTPTGDLFDIDYVVHEMGHQLGGIHTFNDDWNGSCSGNADFTGSYEPGGGSTIMAYAGICDGDNIQAHSDAYFHASSLELIALTLADPAVSSCPIVTPTGNKPVVLPAFATRYTVPYLTAFEFNAPTATDSVADTLTTYCWEEWDLGDFGATFNNTHKSGPIFRSFSPTKDSGRVFPCIRAVVHDSLDYPGEKVPDSARTLVFRLTVRNIYKGIGAYLIPDDSVQLNVINTRFPFTVTSPNTAVNWVDTAQTISWNVSHTDVPPINCKYVNIFLSTDGGYTYPYLLKSHVPNTGVTTISVPKLTTRHARVKIKAEGNIFFDISDKDFSIGLYADDIAIYPNPTGISSNYMLYLRLDNDDAYDLVIFNSVGQRMFATKGSRQFNISTMGWASGVYFVKLKSEQSGQHIQKPFVVR